MLTILSLVSLSCFSQIDISKDTTKVVLSQGTARMVVKDLIRYDGCVDELKLVQNKLLLTEQREIIKDSTISLLTVKDSNNQVIIRKQQDQIVVVQEEVKSLNKDIKKLKFENVIYKVATIVSAFALTILIVTN